MWVIKEHRQDVITGQTLFVVVRAAVGPKQSFWMLVGFLFSYSDAKGACTLSARCTLTPECIEKIVDLCCVYFLRADRSAHSSLSSISDSYFRYQKLLLNASVQASLCAWLLETTSTPPAPSRPSVASLFLGRTSCVWRARSLISKLGMTKARWDGRTLWCWCKSPFYLLMLNAAGVSVATEGAFHESPVRIKGCLSSLGGARTPGQGLAQTACSGSVLTHR